MSSKGQQFLKHVVPAVVKPIRVLWNEIIGFIFLVLGGLIGLSTYRNFRDVEANAGNPLFLIAGMAFALLLIYFGVSSFWKARRISRS
ncbi:MAG TPA: hypothetical protein VEQ63_10560 [Bryobacteraceae bacterium]|nr:hypothetical protein [Bryobacteraceae bacterium]